LQRSKSGHNYLLTIVCVDSKFIHAYPLRTLTAKEIADKLVSFFCLFGLPETIRSNQMTSFTSELWTQVRQRLGINAEFSAPYHYQSHGLIERTNRSIEDVLRKYLQLHGERWEEMLPYILFAPREVPHSGSKISANELVFGRKLRNLLHVAREMRVGADPLQEKLKMSTISYLQALQQRLRTTMQVAQDNMLKSQSQMKQQ